MYNDPSGCLPVRMKDVGSWIYRKINYVKKLAITVSKKTAKILQDIVSIFHKNCSSFIYRNGIGLGVLIHDSGLYYTEFSDGYYIDYYGITEIVDAQIIDAFLVSATILELEDGRIVGGVGVSYGPLSIENYGPDIRDTSFFVTVGQQGGVVYTAGLTFTVDVIELGKDYYNFILGRQK